MEPVGYGFLILVGSAAIFGLLIGAIGGAVGWRFKVNVFLCIAVTACAFLILLIRDQRSFHAVGAQMVWGLPALTMSFLVSSIAARMLAAFTRIRQGLVALAAFGLALGTGLLYLSTFGTELGQLPLTTSVVDLMLIG